MHSDWFLSYTDDGLIIAKDNFFLQLPSDVLDDVLDLLNTNTPGVVQDYYFNDVAITPKDQNTMTVTKSNYEEPVDVPFDAFSDHDDDEPILDHDEQIPIKESLLTEGVIPVFRRSKGKIKRGYRVTSGPRKGRIVADVRTAFAPLRSRASRTRSSIASKKNRFIRNFKSKLTKQRPTSILLRRLNK